MRSTAGCWGHGEGRSKKQAEQAAAREAFDHLVSTVEEVSVDTDDESNGEGPVAAPTHRDA